MTPIEFPIFASRQEMQRKRAVFFSFSERISEKSRKKLLYSIALVVIFLIFCSIVVERIDVSGTSSSLSVANNHVYKAQSYQMYLPWTVSGSAPAVTPTVGNTPEPQGPVTKTSSSWSILGKPTVDAHFINEVLSYYGSPAAGQGQAFYDLGKAYGIDPVYALAFFGHESDFGTTGVARYTRSIGNSRSYDGNKVCTNDGCYEAYASWDAGINEWYWQMTQYTNGNIYVYLHGYRKNLITIDEIIPTYAPPSDYNDDSAYINALKSEIARARSGFVAILKSF